MWQILFCKINLLNMKIKKIINNEDLLKELFNILLFLENELLIIN